MGIPHSTSNPFQPHPPHDTTNTNESPCQCPFLSFCLPKQPPPLTIKQHYLQAGFELEPSLRLPPPQHTLNPPRLPPPQFSQTYQLQSLISVGPTSTTHLCLHCTTGHRYVCKLPHNHSSLCFDRTHTPIQHGHIVQVLTIMPNSHVLMEYLQGGTLLDRILTHGPWKERDARRLMQQVGSALLVISSHGVCNVTPESVLMVSERGKDVKILPKLTRIDLTDEAYRQRVVTQSVELGVILYLVLVGCLPLEPVFPLRFPKKVTLSPLAKSFLTSLFDEENWNTLQHVMEHPWVKGLGVEDTSHRRIRLGKTLKMLSRRNKSVTGRRKRRRISRIFSNGKGTNGPTRQSSI